MHLLQAASCATDCTIEVIIPNPRSFGCRINNKWQNQQDSLVPSQLWHNPLPLLGRGVLFLRRLRGLVQNQQKDIPVTRGPSPNGGCGLTL